MTRVDDDSATHNLIRLNCPYPACWSGTRFWKPLGPTSPSSSASPPREPPSPGKSRFHAGEEVASSLWSSDERGKDRFFLAEVVGGGYGGALPVLRAEVLRASGDNSAPGPVRRYDVGPNAWADVLEPGRTRGHRCLRPSPRAQIRQYYPSSHHNLSFFHIFFYDCLISIPRSLFLSVVFPFFFSRKKDLICVRICVDFFLWN